MIRPAKQMIVWLWIKSERKFFFAIFHIIDCTLITIGGHFLSFVIKETVGKISFAQSIELFWKSLLYKIRHMDSIDIHFDPWKEPYEYIFLI